MNIAELFENGERKKDRCHFRNMVMIARADNAINADEKNLLDKIGTKLNLTPEEIHDLAKNAKTFNNNAPYGREERFEQMINLVQMAQVDGTISDSEMQTLERVAVGIGYRNLDEVDVESILALISRGESTEGIMDELLY